MGRHFFEFQHLQPIWGMQPSSAPMWQPAADLYRCADGWLVKFELAGVRPEDVQIEVDCHEITVSGVRRDTQQFDWRETHLMEIAYSRFERAVHLPNVTKGCRLIVDFRDGMMYVRVVAANQGSEGTRSGA